MSAAWVAERETTRPDLWQKIVITRDGLPLSFAEVITAWRDNAAFRTFYCAQLTAAPYPAYFWEMPPIRRGHTNAPYEFMMIRSDALARMLPDESAFAAEFKSAGNVVATFPNLGGDAMLVAPEQIAAPATYVHLAAFVRAAPQTQQHALFQTLGKAIEGFLHDYDGRVWISTSGLGIAWLHIRLDTHPKYYQHQPYARLQI